MPVAQDRAPSEVLRRRRITLVLLVCAAAGIICFPALRKSSPGDKAVTRYVERLLENCPRQDPEARDALRAMGQPAVRFLTRIAERDPAAWQLRLRSMTADIPVVNRLFGIPPMPRLFAIKALAEMGPAAKSAIPVLEQAAKAEDRMLRMAARAALIRIREESIDSLVAIYRQFETTNSVQTLFLFVELGPYAKPAIPAILDGMQSTNYRVRHLAAFALPHIDCESRELVPPLQRLLSDPNELVRRQALDSLAEFGPLAKAALPQARQLLLNTNTLSRTCALTFCDKVLSDVEFAAIREEVVTAKMDTDSLVSQVAQYVLSKRPHGDSRGFTQSRMPASP